MNSSEHQVIYDAVARGNRSASDRLTREGIDTKNVGGGQPVPKLPLDLCKTLTAEAQRATLEAERALQGLPVTGHHSDALAGIIEQLVTHPWDAGQVRRGLEEEISYRLKAAGLPSVQEAHIHTEDLSGHGLNSVTRVVQLTVDRAALVAAGTERLTPRQEAPTREQVPTTSPRDQTRGGNAERINKEVAEKKNVLCFNCD